MPRLVFLSELVNVIAASTGCSRCPAAQHNIEITNAMPADIETRFWSKVNKDGPVPSHMPHLGPCWIWTAGKVGTGYGAFAVTPTKQKRAHVMAWELTNGPMPEGMLLCHSCDNRSCCRPSHLFPGTHSANSIDAMSKGRLTQLAKAHQAHLDGRVNYCRGSAMPNSKLSEADVNEMRRLHRDESCGYKRLHKRFGVSVGVAQRICNRKMWKWLPDPPEMSNG